MPSSVFIFCILQSNLGQGKSPSGLLAYFKKCPNPVETSESYPATASEASLSSPKSSAGVSPVAKIVNDVGEEEDGEDEGAFEREAPKRKRSHKKRLVRVKDDDDDASSKREVKTSDTSSGRAGKDSWQGSAFPRDDNGKPERFGVR